MLTSEVWILIAIGFVVLFVGLIAGWLLGSSRVNKTAHKMALTKAGTIIKEAEIKAKAEKEEKILQAKEKFLHLKSEHDKNVQSRNNDIAKNENRLKQKEQELNKKLEDLGRKERETEQIRNSVSQQLDMNKRKQEDLDKTHRQYVDSLQKLSGMSPEEAKSQMAESMKAEAKTEAMAYIKDVMDEAKINASKEAKKIVIQSIQRVATEHAIENAVTVFHIESDEMKGRIIGKDGRSREQIEHMTDCEISVLGKTVALIGLPEQIKIARNARSEEHTSELQSH